MRIGIDARLWNETGVGRYIRNLVQELSILDTKNEYRLFVQSKDIKEIQSLEFIIQNKNFRLVPTNINWHSVKEQVAFPRIITKEKLDLMHFTYVSVPIFYTRPFVVTIHDLIPYHFPTGKASTLPEPVYEFKNQMYRVVIHAAAARARQIITPLNSTKKDVVETLHVTDSKVHVTYEGFDEMIGKQENVSEEIKELVSKQKYFLYVGNAYPHKNVERMINAFLQLQEGKKYPCSLVVVGRDDYFYKKVKKAVKSVEEIHFLHDVSDSELGYLYSHALALVAPSLLEGFGLTVLEAMSNDCLVLASDIPAFKEVCEEAAVYFDPYSEKALLSKLVEVYNLSSEKRKNYQILGKKRLPLFSWKHMASLTLNIYESSFGIRSSE